MLPENVIYFSLGTIKYVCMYLYIYIYICMYVCMYVCIYEEEGCSHASIDNVVKNKLLEA